MLDSTGVAQYPWAHGEVLTAAALNAAIAQSSGANTGASAPSSPTIGMIWFNPTTGLISVWTGTAWQQASYLPLAGATMSGPLILSGDPPAGTQQAATAHYVDTAVAAGAFLPLTGGTVTGPTTFSANTNPGVTAHSLVLNNTPSGVATLLLTQSQGLSGSQATGTIGTHTTVFGATSAIPSLHSFSIDSDRVAAPNGLYGFNVAHGFGGGTGTPLTGGRTGFNINLTMTGDCASGSGGGSYYAAGGMFTTASYWNGGYPGAETGSLFGINPSARAQNAGSIGSWGYRSTVGCEINVGQAHNMGSKTGLQVVEWGDSVADGWVVSMGYGIATQIGGTAPGFDFLFAIGNPSGWWPARATSTLIGNYATVGAASGPTAQLGVGFDLRNIQLNYFGYVQSGAAIDGAGNIGGGTVSGTTLQARDGVSAATATVASIAPVKGGEFYTMPTLAVSAPPGSGTAATATVATMGLRRAISIVGHRGTGYAVGNVLTLAGGTFTTAATCTVAAVDTNGAIVDFTYTPGSYTVLPAVPTVLSGGAGSGAQLTQGGWSILTVTATAGANYPAFPPPLVTTSGGAKTVEPMFNVTMTPTAATLALQSGGGLTTVGGALTVTGTITGSLAGGPYAPLASPTFTGTVTMAELTATGTVGGAGFTTLLAPYAPLASPAFTGTPTAPALTVQQTVALNTGSGILTQVGDVVTANSSPVLVSYLVGSASGAATRLGWNSYLNTGGLNARVNSAKNAWHIQHDVRNATNDANLVFQVVSSAGSAATVGTLDTGGGLTMTGGVTAATVVQGGSGGFRQGASGPTWTSGAGVPATTTPVGSLYSNTSGGVGARLYVSAGGGTWTAVAGV